MDNVTHSLIGVLLGRAAAPYVGSSRGAIVAAIIASNLPDIDFAWMSLFSNPKLGYLVHHRGHTHTLLLAPILSLVCTLAVQRWEKEAKFGPLLGLSLLSGWLHIGADSWNNYGVHPFWPLESRWFYGDAVFIVEPWLWAVLGPLAFVVAGPRWKGLLGLIGALGGIAVGTVLGPGMAVLWALVALGGALLGGRLMVGGVGSLLVLGLFEIGGRQAQDRVEHAVGSQVPEEELLEVIRSPLPAEPWCWSFIAVSLGPGGAYHLRPGTLSLAGTDPKKCSLRQEFKRSVAMRSADLSDTPEIRWEGSWTRPVREIQEYAQNCQVDAFLHFARAPWWNKTDAGIEVGDLRYDFEPEAGFTEFTFGPATTCMELPPWRSQTVERLLKAR